MRDLDWNRTTWDGQYDWSAAGEEWSAAWGDSGAQWLGSLAPRIGRFLPTGRVLEIAPGFGRWTKFLLTNADELTGIDLSQECVDSCLERFAGKPATFLKNDGLSLDAAPDNFFDFVFSFDSLVHAEVDVMEVYIPQLVAKLRAGGVAFVHHSNWLDAGSAGPNPHQRAESVSAALVAQMISDAGGQVLLQELVNWGGEVLSDSLTLFGRPTGGVPTLPHRVLENRSFVQETDIIKKFQSPWGHLPSW